ncbi:hypothetical protein NXY56_008192 [Leishmania guyanensis]|uniref:Uncharacterized protein n=1 Tax=Leishmania guyanensis TaxID=5670 RepID=A0A1E1J8B6_LEIGU|nr:hypothetical protein, conserved [Leishmania guyanensis]
MTEPGHSSSSSSSSDALRFHAAHRTEVATKLLVDPVPHQAVVRSDSSSSPDAGQATLEAFMNSYEEDAVSFIASFLHLTHNDRVTALAKLEGYEESPSAVDAAAGNAVPRACKSGAPSADLRQPLQQHELLAAQRALAERHTAHVQEKYAKLLSLARPTHRYESELQSLDKAISPASVGVSYAAVCVAEKEGLETIQLEDGTRTGNLVAFLDKGMTEVLTNFDNFFEMDAPPPRALFGVPEEPRGDLPTPSSQLPLPTLDEILTVDAEEVEEPATSLSGQSRLSPTPCARDTGVTSDALEERSPSGRESCASSMTSAEESVALPGLQDSCVNLGTPDETFRETYNADFLAQLQEVFSEEDNYVQSFALDPFFNYDADLLGEAFRAGAAWRQD